MTADGAIVATFTLNVRLDADGVERQGWDIEGALTHETLLGRLEIVKAQLVAEVLDE